MQILTALFLAFTLHTQAALDVHPNGEPFIGIQCVQCGDWYVPLTEQDLTCPCDYVE